MSKVPGGNRRTVLARSAGLCERCARWLANIPADIHHRRPRGMGGTSKPEIHQPANLLALCRDCHRWVEENRALALEQGWLISQHDTREPYEIPIYAHGSWYLVNLEWHPYDIPIPF